MKSPSVNYILEKNLKSFSAKSIWKRYIYKLHHNRLFFFVGEIFLFKVSSIFIIIFPLKWQSATWVSFVLSSRFWIFFKWNPSWSSWQVIASSIYVLNQCFFPFKHFEDFRLSCFISEILWGLRDQKIDSEYGFRCKISRWIRSRCQKKIYWKLLFIVLLQNYNFALFRLDLLSQRALAQKKFIKKSKK